MSSSPTNLFTHHPRSWRDNRYVYPVISRRSRGLSIGINLNPDKACNFDCVYCCVDRSIPPHVKRVDLDIVHEELDHLLHLAISRRLFDDPPFDQAPPHLHPLCDVAFSGDGEPSACNGFGEACRLVASALARHEVASATKIVVITNATFLHRPTVIDALAFLDTHNGEIWAKLDAGTEAWYHTVERTAVPFQRVLDNLLSTARLRPIVIQSLFLTLNGEPPPPGEIDAYTQRLADLQAGGGQIDRVQVYTIARPTADQSVAPLPPAALDAIAGRVRSLGLHAEAFYAPE